MSDIRVVEFKKKSVDSNTERNHKHVIETLERMLEEAKKDPTYTMFAVISTGESYLYEIAGNDTVSTMVGLTHLSLHKLVAHKISLE